MEEYITWVIGILLAVFVIAGIVSLIFGTPFSDTFFIVAIAMFVLILAALKFFG